ncbi:uncharacterized protein Os04g0629400-like [Actinidia eriantha]|uniref:uncharacterized protein Os04g0629400-like n=1 Tax=Actinidia eriantha TaxID=165200 RepID=UPI002583D02F|nr:uncharacterized protein Os04g0629400-like [Actinidia eriantha]
MCYVGKATKIFIFIITALVVTGLVLGFGLLRKGKAHKCPGDSCHQPPVVFPNPSPSTIPTTTTTPSSPSSSSIPNPMPPPVEITVAPPPPNSAPPSSVVTPSPEQAQLL